MKPLAVLVFPVFALLGALAASPASAAAPAPPPASLQQKAPPGAGTEQKAPAPQPPDSIPVPEIAKQAEEVTKLLRDLEVLAAPGPEIEAIRARLPDLGARLGPELQATIETLKQAPPPTIVEGLTQAWQARALELAAPQEILTNRATQLERELARLAGLSAAWTQTRTGAKASSAPTAVVERVSAVLGDIEATRAQLQAQRAATLVLQDRVAQELARCQEALARIGRFRQGTLALTFERNTLPIWSAELRGRPLEELPARAREAVVATVAVLRQFVEDRAVRLLLHGLLFIALVLLARAARRGAQRPIAAGEAAPAATTLFDRPYSSAAVVALVSVFWIYPDRPRTVGDVFGILMLLPLVRIVRPLVRPAMAPALYGFCALIFADRLRAQLVVVPLADQALLLVEMLAGMLGLAWLLGSGRLRRAPAGERIAPDPLPGAHVAAGLALGVCVASFGAAAYGTLRLARILGSGALVSVFLALVAYAAVQVADGLLAFAFRVWPLRRLGMVERHRDLLERRAHRWLCWIMAGVWAAVTLRHVTLLEPAVALGRTALALELQRGAIAISLGDILAFALTVWLAFLLSALIRFVLEEDVFPRVRLARGVPYLMSRLLHYAILVLGFVLAVSALGVDLNKATILAGAFGVGLGFGLQGMVNNFVSGLVLLFERTLHVGDAIQTGDVVGEVRRIGIRSSTVRTPEGAEVIVPNASLVAEKVTNWTLSDRVRCIDVPVGVAYGSEPEKVLELLREVAAAHPHVLARPAPQPLFLGFGDSALLFELRAWTDRFDQWPEVRSSLAVALYAALRGAGMEIPFPQREMRLRRE